MSEASPEESIRRILVALDASPHSLAALRVAVDLAAHLGAEIQGLYVEDITILQLSELPPARRVAVFTYEPRQLDREHLQQELRAQARQAGRALADLASRARLRWSFRVAQGSIPAELLNAAQEVDLILVGKSGWSRRRRLGSTARIIVAQAPARVMVLQQGARLTLPVGVVYDGSPASQKALQTAAALLQEQRGYLVIFILAADFETARNMQSELSGWLQSHDLQARFRWLVQGSPEALREMYRSESCGVLVLPGNSQLLPGADLEELVNGMDCPVLIVR